MMCKATFLRRRTRILMTAAILLIGSKAFAEEDKIAYHSEGVIDINRDTYLYAGKIMYDSVDNLFKYWGCAGVAGDVIGYKQSATYDGLQNAVYPWRAALAPSRRTGTFDKNHTCDPSVIDHEGLFYLYYGGIDDSLPKSQQATRIGVAVSTDRGRTFTRLFNGNPIVDSPATGIYGVGQPTVTRGPDGMFYMLYTENYLSLTDGRPGPVWHHVLRSPVPSFPPKLRSHLATYAGHELGGVSVELAYNRGRGRFEVVVNGSTEDPGLARVRVVHLDRRFRILGATEYAAQRGYRFGEGVSILTNRFGEIAAWRGETNQGTRVHVNLVGTTYGPPRLGPDLVHITGPVRYLRFSEGPRGVLTDFSHWGEIGFSGDLDGDGKADRIVVDPLSFVWKWKLSSDGFDKTHSVQWGLPGLDVPLITRDWDKNGKQEIAVFRQYSGMWYIHHEGQWPFARYDAIQWGLPGDYPFSADTDGDGKGELIVWRPLNGTWYTYYSGQSGWPSGRYSSVQWGLEGDQPAIDDVDNNGHPDFIVWRPSNSTTHVRHN